MASGRTAIANSGMISGVGLAIAKINGLGPMVMTMSCVNTPGADKPMNKSAPTIASAKVRSSVSLAYASFHWFMPSPRPL